MAPSRHGILVLLGLIASIRAVPAPVAEPDVPARRQIGLIPPFFSVSWDNPAPVSTEDPEPEDPEDPEDPEEPALPTYPSPSNQISLSPPSFSVSWDPPLPTKTRKPWPPRPTKKTTTKPGVSATVSWGKREDYEGTEATNAPEPRDDISLSPPTYSISWDPPLITKTKKPWPPRPTKKTTTKSGVTATVSWGKRQEDEDPEPTDFPEPQPTDEPEPEDPNGPIDIPPNFPTPGNSLGIQPPQVSFSWGKRDDAAYKTTYPAPTFELGNPTASIWWPKPPKHTSGYISWGKRQDEEEPTEIIPPAPTPSDEISINPPTASMSWGKRDDTEDPTETYPPPTWWLGNPTASIWWPKPPKHTSGYISWGKRQDDEPTTLLPPILPTPPDQISANPPSASISWGKREDPPPTYGIVWPSFIPKPTWDLPKPPVPSSPNYVSWAKRDEAPEPTAAAQLAEAEAAQFTCGLTTTVTRPVPCPLVKCSAPCRSDDDDDDDDDDVTIQSETSAYTSIACPVTSTVPAKCPTCHCPSTLITRKPTPTKGLPPTGTCSTVTKTIAPPCIPPTCPHSLIACKTAEATVQEVHERGVEAREIEKTIVSIKTFTVPSGTATPIIDKCTPLPTVTVNIGCPTYTCVPWCAPTARV